MQTEKIITVKHQHHFQGPSPSLPLGGRETLGTKLVKHVYRSLMEKNLILNVTVDERKVDHKT